MILSEIRYFLIAEDLFNDVEQSWALDIINNKIPSKWNINSILSLNAWINHFVEGFVLIFTINRSD